jgi:hypothetical protein
LNPSAVNRESVVNLNLSGLVNLECLSLRWFKFDLKQYDPFENLHKLRQLCLYLCHFENFDDDFFKRLPNLERLDYFCPSNTLTLNHFSSLTQLKSLYLKLVITSPIEEDTFRGFANLEYLLICAKRGKWMRHLTKLRGLGIKDLGSDVLEDFAGDWENHLESLEIWNDVKIKSGAFNGLKHLKSLKIYNPIQQIEAKEFEGLENLKNLQIAFASNGVFSLKSYFFERQCF